MRSIRLALTLVSFLFLGACSGGGEDDGRRSGSGSGLGNVNIANMTSAEGAAVAEVVMPLYQGDIRSVPGIVTDADQPCQVFEMGPRFPDGSLRYLRLEVPVEVTSKEQRTVELRQVSGSPGSFQQHPDIPGRIGVDATFRVGANKFAFPEASLLEEGPVTRVYRSRVRAAGTMFWAELTVNLYSGQPHAKFTLQWGNSDPRNPELGEDPGTVELQVRGAKVEFEYEKAKILSRRESGGVTFAVLHSGGVIADGQSQMVEGRFVFGGAESPPRVFAIADNWTATGTYGPFGYLVDEIPVDPAEFAKLIETEDGSQTDHPWAKGVHACNANPRDTGYQSDFGTMKMRADVLLADPRRLQTITRSVYQEACRITHLREVDVSPIQLANHPDLVMLSGRPRISESPDNLGKKREYSPAGMKTPRGANWQGHDPEHLSINFLAGLALLTGNRFAREECDLHAVAYLAGFTYESGTWADVMGPARQIGRTSLAAVWIWLVTGDQDVATRVGQRTEVVLEQMGESEANLDVIVSRGSYWVPWEEGIALAGMAAVQRNFDSVAARKVVELGGRTLVANGLAQIEGRWHCGYKPPLKFANGSDYVALRDPDFATKHAAGNGLTTWSMPGVMIAADQHPDGAVRTQALKIIREHYGQATNGLAEELEWICVSPNVVGLTKMIGVQ